MTMNTNTSIATAEETSMYASRLDDKNTPNAKEVSPRTALKGDLEVGLAVLARATGRAKRGVVRLDGARRLAVALARRQEEGVAVEAVLRRVDRELYSHDKHMHRAQMKIVCKHARTGNGARTIQANDNKASNTHDGIAQKKSAAKPVS